jgi:lysophospholipase L1-like esterase
MRTYIHYKFGVPGKSYGIYQYDAELGASHRPNSYNRVSVINNWGFRNLEDITEQKPTGATRIYCSGGSTTFCYNLPTADAWPTLLQDELRKVPGHEHDEVLNNGFISGGCSAEFILAKRFIPKLKPDIVIIHTGVNEALAGYALENQGQSLDTLLKEQHFGVVPKHQAAGFLERYSVLYKFMTSKSQEFFEKHATQQFRQTNPQPVAKAQIHPWVIANFDHVLREYIAFLRQQGCRIIMVRYPDNGAGYAYVKDVLLPLREQAMAIARDEGVEMCDPTAAFEKVTNRKALFSDSGVHVSKPGAEMLADALEKQILKTDQSK